MNIYQPTKVALSFCLAPDFLPEVESPKKPFGMFFNIGPFPRGASVVDHVLTCTLGGEFRSLYNPFKDVARGGIRIVMSRNREYVHPCALRLLRAYSCVTLGTTPSISACCEFM